MLIPWILTSIALAAPIEPALREGAGLPSEAAAADADDDRPRADAAGEVSPSAAVTSADAAGGGAPAIAAPPRRRRLAERLSFFPYGWVRTDANYYSAKREGYSNLSLSGVRLGGGAGVGPITVFAAIEVGQAKGPRLFDAFVRWDVSRRLSLRAGQFKAPFGYRFNTPDLVDELTWAPLSMLTATPGRQVGFEGRYDFWGHALLSAAIFSGIGQNREANNTKVAFASKLEVRPLATLRRGPELRLVGSLFTYTKTNGFSPTIRSALGFEFFHGVPANGRALRVAGGAALFWRYLSLRAEYYYTYDGRQLDTDGDPFTPGEPLPPMIGAGAYGQVGVIVTGQDKDPDTLLPRLASARVRDSALELSARAEFFRSGARDVVGNGVETLGAGVNWVVLRHLRVFVAANWQALDAAVPEIPSGRSWGFGGGIAGYFLDRGGV
ncbi:MAG: porin [Nannocystaceae bacterium]